MSQVKALGFDVFGTVVDWRTSITREGEAFGRAHGISGVDWVKFADAWRRLYQPFMNKVRHGEIGWTKLDDLHRMALDQLLGEFNIKGVPRPTSIISIARGTASIPGRTPCQASRA